MDPLPAHPATPGGSARERYSILLSRLVASGQWERSLAAARDWLAAEPEALPAHRAAAQALINLQRYKSASPHLQKVLSINPDDGFACRLASIAYFHQGRYNRADECIQRAIRLQPEEAMHWYHLAWMRYRHGARGMALKHARRALELAPNDADILNLIALCEPVEPKQQLARYQQALELDPENAIIHNNVGTHYLNAEKDYRGAIEAFRRALALNPKNRTAQKNLFIAMHERDPLHRALLSPSRFVARFNWNLGKPGFQRVLTTVFIKPWLSLVLIAVGLPWMMFSLPLLVAYEPLLAHDIEVQAGLISARRGGWLGFWRWPRWTRTGALLIVYGACWAGILAWICHVFPAASELPPFSYPR